MCSCRWCYPDRIALVSHDTYEIRNVAFAFDTRARIFGSHHGDRQGCPGLRDWRGGLWHERLVRRGSHCGVLYYAAPEYCAEARHLKSRNCRLSADRSLDFMARTDRSRKARARRACTGPWASALLACTLCNWRISAEPTSSLLSRLRTSISSSGSERTRRSTTKSAGLKHRFGTWMSSSMPSVARRSSGRGVSSSQVDA